MDDRGVVAASQGFADILEGLGRHIAAEIHHDLPGEYQLLAALLADDIQGIDPKMLRHHIKDQLGSHFLHGIGGDQVL